MPEKITYYAVVGAGRSVANPSGLVAQTLTRGGARVDESLTPRFHLGSYNSHLPMGAWGNFGPELVEIGAQEAEALIERFREKWA